MPEPTIFVSHASADDAIVTRLHDELESATGQNLWVDHRDISPGDDWQAEIDRALRECPNFVLVLSRNSANRPEVTAEWRYALTIGRRLLPVVIDDLPPAELPYRLSTIQRVSLFPDWAAGMSKLVRAIRGETISEDGARFVAWPITGHIDRRLTQIPISGRADDLAAIKKLLRQGPTMILGVGGLGKSRLAAEIVMTAEGVSGAIWHTASDTSRADSVLELLREHFGLDVTAPRHDVMVKLRANKRLVVLDNLESVPDERRAEYVTLVDELHDAGTLVLMTSRVKWKEFKLDKLHAPRPLSLDAALQIVIEMGQKWESPYDLTPHARSIADAALCHPRLIEWAVGLSKELPLEVVMDDLKTRDSDEAEAALDEMIHKTLRQMSDREGIEHAIALRKLEVCRGGFTYEAAKTILRTDDQTIRNHLRVLQTYQFVKMQVQDNRTRFVVDPVVIEAVGEDDTAHRAHYDFYLTRAEAYDRRQDYLGLDVESENLTAAFERMIEKRDGEAALWLANAASNLLANRGRFALRLDWMQRVEAISAGVTNEQVTAAVNYCLGIAYQEYPTGNRRENLNRAMTAYAAALVHWTPEAAPRNYGKIQIALGNAYRAWAEIEDRQKNLRQAVKAYKTARMYCTPETAPLDYAMTQNNLGIAYHDLAQIEDRDGNLRQAVKADKAALVYRTPETTPLAYAETQNNLGNVYRDLAQIEEREANLRRAVTAYEAARMYWTPETAPLDYAGMQNNLGETYRNLSQIEDREGNLRRAVEAYKVALVYWTPEAVPLDYAKTQINLGAAYDGLAQIEDREGNLRRAVAAYEAALVYLTPETEPLNYAKAQANLGAALMKMDDLAQAVICWREAERYFRLMDWIEDADQMLRQIAGAEGGET